MAGRRSAMTDAAAIAEVRAARATHTMGMAQHAVGAAALAIVTMLLLFWTEPQIGLTWDEPAYIIAAKSYVAWFQHVAATGAEALRPETITHYWEWNHEHPPLDKIWSGLIWAATRPFLDDLPAHRLGNMVLVAIGIGGLYYTVARSFGSLAGLAASLALLSLPRFFFHAHLAALDVPAAMAVFLLTALFWHTRRNTSIGWDLALGVAWGAALATKINALFVLPTWFFWLLIFERRAFLIRRLTIAGICGLPVFVALWPWLYHDTAARLVAYLRFITVDHWQIGQWYFHRWFMPPPWHFPFVMLIAVTPAAILLLACLNVARTIGARHDPGEEAHERRAASSLWALSALVPLLALAAGRTMVYDNERLFMPTFPFLAALAGAGLEQVRWMLRAVLATWRRAYLTVPVTVCLAAGLFTPHLASTLRLYPHLLSYYSETVGGLRGAARIGLETTYWCETYAEAIPYINANATPGSIIWVEDWSHDVLLYYQFNGRLRPDVSIALAPGAGSLFSRYGLNGVRADIADADYVIVTYRQTGLAVHPKIERWKQGRTPILTIEREGLPLMELYR